MVSHAAPCPQDIRPCSQDRDVPGPHGGNLQALLPGWPPGDGQPREQDLHLHQEVGALPSPTLPRNGLKDETVHLETRSAAEETDVIGHEVLVTLAREDTMDVYVEETSDKLYGVMLCVALV